MKQAGKQIRQPYFGYELVGEAADLHFLPVTDANVNDDAHSGISATWQQKARNLQTRRWQIINQKMKTHETAW